MTFSINFGRNNPMSITIASVEAYLIPFLGAGMFSILRTNEGAGAWPGFFCGCEGCFIAISEEPFCSHKLIFPFDKVVHFSKTYAFVNSLDISAWMYLLGYISEQRKKTFLPSGASWGICWVININMIEASSEPAAF